MAGTVFGISPCVNARSSTAGGSGTKKRSRRSSKCGLGIAECGMIKRTPRRPGPTRRWDWGGGAARAIRDPQSALRDQAAASTWTNFRPFLPVWKRTRPSLLAKRVSSLPRPTLVPGWKRVPRWRTMMEPAETTEPPNTLTPSIFGFESRPFLDEPTPFLCAMGPGGWRAEGAGSGGLFGLLLPGALGAAGAEVGDGDLRVGLAVAVLDAVALAALLLEDDDLVGLHVAEHLEAGRGAVDGG